MYEPLIKKLKEQGNWLGYTEWTRDTFLQAADAIEKLSKELINLKLLTCCCGEPPKEETE